MTAEFLEAIGDKVILNSYRNIAALSNMKYVSSVHLANKIREIISIDDFILIYVFIDRAGGLVLKHFDYTDGPMIEKHSFNILKKTVNLQGLEFLIQTRTDDQLLLVKTIIDGWTR